MKLPESTFLNGYAGTGTVELQELGWNWGGTGVELGWNWGGLGWNWFLDDEWATTRAKMC